MDVLKTAQSLLPRDLAALLGRYPLAEELRLRCGQRPGIVLGGRELQPEGNIVSQEQLMTVLERATGASMHAAAPSLCSGFLSYHGLRIGVCGEGVFSGGSISGMRKFSSLAIRMPHVFRGELNEQIRPLLEPGLSSILILSPPGVGKTTLLRELIRLASQRRTVSVIDERNELACSSGGRAQLDLGPRTDVMTGIGKADAAMMLLRGMRPDIIAMDEITRPEDLRAVEQIAGCGVALFATAHGSTRDDMEKRPLYRELLAASIFDTLITIRLSDGDRVYLAEELKG